MTADLHINQLYPLQTVQNRAIRIAFREPMDTPVDILHKISGLPTIKDRLISLKANAITRFNQHDLLKETEQLIKLYTIQ